MDATTGTTTPIATGLLFPECPRLHDGAVWFTDGPRVCSVVPGEALQVRAEMPGPVTLGLDFLPDGRAVVNGVFERVTHTVGAGGAVEPWVDLSDDAVTLNELVLTADGGLLVEDLGFDPVAGEPPVPVRLLRVHPDGRRERTGPELLFPNGMQMLDDRRRLVVSDGLGARVVSVEVRDDGTLSDSVTIVADLRDHNGHPDGICVAPDGALWYADPFAGEIVKVENNRVARRLRTEYPHPTSCVLDGDGTTLYVTATHQLPTPGSDLQFDGRGALLAVNVS